MCYLTMEVVWLAACSNCSSRGDAAPVGRIIGGGSALTMGSYFGDIGLTVDRNEGIKVGGWGGGGDFFGLSNKIRSHILVASTRLYTCSQSVTKVLPKCYQSVTKVLANSPVNCYVSRVDVGKR